MAWRSEIKSHITAEISGSVIMGLSVRVLKTFGVGLIQAAGLLVQNMRSVNRLV
jgi:hypothetical protein